MFGVFAQREVRRDARLLALGKGGRPVGGGPFLPPCQMQIRCVLLCRELLFDLAKDERL